MTAVEGTGRTGGTGGPGGTVLVTGATGTVGRHVTDLLRRRGVAVRRAVRDPAGDGDAETCRFDFADPSSWPAALEGVDRVFLMRPPAISDVAGVIGPFVSELARRDVRQTVVLSVMGSTPRCPTTASSTP